MYRALVLTGCALLCASPGAAQTLPTRASVTFGVGSLAGVATDDSAAKRVYAGSIRFDVRRHFAVEGEVARWGRKTNSVSGPGNFTDPSTVFGHFDSVTIEHRDSTWSTTISAIAHSTGRLSVFGGGGVGFGVSRTNYSVSYVGCSAPTRPQTCDGYSLPRSGSGGIVQGVGGIDARFADRIGAFASVAARSGYLFGPANISVLGGLRVYVW